MPPIPRQQLIATSLRVIDEAARRALDGPIERTWGIKLALIVLQEGHDRAIFDTFWRVIVEPLRNNESLDFGRHQTLNNAAAHIHYLHGVKRPG